MRLQATHLEVAVVELGSFHMTRARQIGTIARVGFAITTAIVAYPFVWLFDRIADFLYRPADVKSIEDCVNRVCRIVDGYRCGERNSWASMIRRTGYRRFHDSITFEMLRDALRQSPSACAAWRSYCDDIRYTPAWSFGSSDTDGRFVAAYSHNDPAKSRKYFYQTQEEACARFLLGFLGQF